MTIELTGLLIHGFHGALDWERERGQNFLFDVELEVGEAGSSDKLEDAVDYRDVAACVQGGLGRACLPPARGARDRGGRRAGRALPGRARLRARAQAGRRARSAGHVRGRARHAPVTVAYVGLGANLGDREATIRAAIAELPGVVAVSTLRETDPVGVTDQPRFLNGVAALETELPPRELLDVLLAVERGLGRERGERWGPRTIDLDLLLYGDEVIDEPGLTDPASAPARAPVRPGAARRARAGARRSGPGRGGRPARGARLSAMSHLDDLDEFEAELELTLKREYTAVFGLFRYCILTADATYLCNKLDLQVSPQASYPFFHVKMEDVWVWDKNRPTRIIPRAEVYTSSDVTVEELRGENDDPKLTAEALAERLGERLSTDDDTP